MANKIYFTVFIWLFCFFSVNAQVWPKYYGLPNSKERAKDIIEAYDKGYLILGSYPQFSWLIKTDINGNVLWEKIIDNYPREAATAQAIEVTADGGILLCGMALSGFSNKNCPFVMKLNACGEKEWCKIFEGSPNAFPVANDIKETESGDIVLLVNHFGSIPQETIHLFKLDAEGEVIWKKAYATTYNHIGSGIKQGSRLIITAQNEYLVSGYGYWKHPWNPGGPVYIRPLYIMVESNGYEKWVLPVGLSDTTYGRGKSSYQIDIDRFVGVADKWLSSTVTTSQLLLINFDGDLLKNVVIDNESISPDITKGVPVYIEFLEDKAVLGGLYGNQTHGFATEILLDSAIFSNITIIEQIQHTNTGDIYNLSKSNSNKLVNQSNYYHSTIDSDIFLAKLNLNLEYDTAYTIPITYDSLCTSGAPQSGFIYLNDCAIDIDLPGDSNCDAIVSLNDIVSSVAKILGGIPQPFCPQNADANGDGVLNVVDVVETANIIVGRRGRY